MSEMWEPDMASLPLEEQMEERDLCEQDRDELRRFAEVLRRRRAKKEGETLPPLPEGMKDWLLGKE